MQEETKRWLAYSEENYETIKILLESELIQQLNDSTIYSSLVFFFL
jgi:hypothetical protein